MASTFTPFSSPHIDSGVPAVAVNGKYKTSAGEAGSYQNVLEVIDELIAREEVNR